MSEKLRHSALPFRIHHIECSDTVHVTDSDGVSICEVDSTYTGCAKANAEFIVRACNSFDDLLAVCENLVNRTKNIGESKFPSRAHFQAFYSEWEEALEAIIKAKGDAE